MKRRKRAARDKLDIVLQGLQGHIIRCPDIMYDVLWGIEVFFNSPSFPGYRRRFAFPGLSVA